MAIEITWQESDIEDYLCKKTNQGWRKTNLNKLPGCKNLIIVGRQVKVLDFFIDILAYDRASKSFIIIELKKDVLDANALTQAMRYQNILEHLYYGLNSPKKFKILLIGRNLNEKLYYIVNKLDDGCFDNDWRELGYLNSGIFYTLYNYSFEDGIEFNWHNTRQQEIEYELGDLEDQAHLIKWTTSVHSIAERSKNGK